MMVKKNNTFEIKEVNEKESDGIKKISGIANKFEVIDSYGDVTHKETFINSVKDKPKVPLLWGHNMSDVIGIASLSNKEDGLWADMEINTKTIVGTEAYEITKQLHNAGRPMQLSIGYRTIKATYEERENELVRHLNEVEVLEISLTPIGANSESEVQDVKNTSNVNKSDFNKLLLAIQKTLNQTKEIKGSGNMKRLRELLQQKAEKEKELKTLKSSVETKSDISEDDKKQIKDLLAQIKDIVDEITELQALQEDTEEAEKSLKKIGEFKNTNYEKKLLGQENNKKTINLNNQDEVLSSDEYKTAWLKSLQKKTLNDQENHVLSVSKKFLQVGTNPTGNEDASPAIPTTIWNQIIAKLKQTSQLINYVSISNIAGNVKFAVEKDSSGGGWHKEGTDITGKADLKPIILNGYEWAKMISASESALAMTISDFENFIINNLVREFGVAMENAIANGTGAENLQPTGILVEKDIPTITLTGEITYDSILQIIGSLPTSYAVNSRFAMSRKTFYQNVLGLKDKNDRPLVTNILIDGVTRYAILGYEVIISDYYKDFATATETDKVISFGDFSEYKLNFNKPLEVKRNDSIYFDKGLIAFRGLAIADGRYILSEAMINVIKGTAPTPPNAKK